MIKKEDLSLIVLFFIIFIIYYFLYNYSPFFNVLYITALFALFFILFKFLKIDSIVKFIEKRSLILLFFIIVFSLIVLYRANLFGDGIIVHWDYPFHFFRTSILTYELLPKFQNLIGWIKYFQAGMLEMYDYPPLPYLITSMLFYTTLGEIPLTLLFRITVAMSFILPIIGIYFLSKSLKLGNAAALLSSLFWLGFLHDQFISGNYTTYMSIGFAFLGLTFYCNYLNEKKKTNLMLSSLLFSATILSNPMIFVPIIFFMLVTIREISKKDFLIIILICVGISFVWFVEVYEGIEYILSIHPLGLSVHPEWFDIYYQFLYRFVYLTPAIFFLIFIGLFLEIKDKFMQKILFYVFLNIVFLVLIEQLQKSINILSIFQPEKTIIFLRGFFIILSVYFTCNLFKEHKFSKSLFIILKTLIITSIIMSSIAFIPYLFFSWSEPMSSFTKQVRGLNPPFNLSQGFFAYEPKSSTIEVFDWIKENTDNSSRILFEDSNEGFLGGYMLSIAPLYTERNFIGGPFVHMMLTDQDANAFNGIIMGKNIKNYSIEEFENKLKKFNIHYIVAWTPEFGGFLNKYNTFELKHKSEDSFLKIYEYLNAQKNYITTTNKLSKAYTGVFENNEMIFRIENAKINDKILISSTYNSHWNAIINGKPVNLEKDDLHLTSFISPYNGNYTLTLFYKKDLIEDIGIFVSLMSFIMIIIVLVYIRYYKY